MDALTKLTKAMTAWCDSTAREMLASGWVELSPDEAASFMAKGFMKKYFERKPTGNPARPWRYFYKKPVAKPKRTHAPVTFVPSSPHLPEETWRTHFDAHPWQGGEPTPERHKLHVKIINETLGNKPSKIHPSATFVIGGMGAGKSTTLAAGRNRPDAVRIDPDEIRGELPEYQRAIADADAVASDAGSKTYVEAGWIAQKAREKAVDKKNDLLIDGTGRDHVGISALMNDLKKKGYTIHLIGVHVDPHVGLARIKARANENRRMVPEDQALGSYKSFPNSFDKLKRHAHSYEAWTTSRPRKGGHAQKILSKKHGENERHRNPALVHELLHKPLEADQ